MKRMQPKQLVSVSLTFSVIEQIKRLAEEREWSFSYTVSRLVDLALIEECPDFKRTAKNNTK